MNCGGNNNIKRDVHWVWTKKLKVPLRKLLATSKSKNEGEEMETA